MAFFSYTALDQQNAYNKGRLEARSVKVASLALERQGLLVINLRREESQNWMNLHRQLGGVTAQDKIFFTRNLQTMLEAGISVDQAISTTAEQTSNPAFRAALFDIAQKLQSGQPLHRSLGLYPKYFSPFFMNMIRVGESSGKLDETLSHLLRQQEQDAALKTKARSAAIYPVIIFCVLILMVTLMLTFVIPKVAGILGSFNVQLPLATRILLFISHAVTTYGYIIIPVLAILIYLFYRWTKSKRGKWRWDGFLLRIPRIGKIIQEYNVALFTRSLTALLQSGVSLDQAIELSGSVVPNQRFAQAATKGITFIQKGIPLHEVLKGSPQLWPPLSLRMVEVGEKTGKLTHMLERLAVFYESSVQTSLTNLSAVIEPLLLLTIGLTVGFVAIAVITPIWKYSATI